MHTSRQLRIRTNEFTIAELLFFFYKENGQQPHYGVVPDQSPLLCTAFENQSPLAVKNRRPSLLHPSRLLYAHQPLPWPRGVTVQPRLGEVLRVATVQLGEVLRVLTVLLRFGECCPES